MRSRPVIPSSPVVARTTSGRLDEEAQRALAELMRGGRSRSQAIRDALTIASDREWREQGRKDAARLAADPADRAALAELRQDVFGES